MALVHHTCTGNGIARLRIEYDTRQPLLCLCRESETKYDYDDKIISFHYLSTINRVQNYSFLMKKQKYLLFFLVFSSN